MEPQFKIHLILLLSNFIVVLAQNEFNCQVLYLAGNNKLGGGEASYSLNATLSSVPSSTNGQYCNFSRSLDWVEYDSTKIICRQQHNVWIQLGQSYNYANGSYEFINPYSTVLLNCTARFPLDIYVDENIVADNLEFDFGNAGKTFYWLAVKFPQPEICLQQEGTSSGNYTFYDKFDPNVNHSINVHIEMGTFNSDTGNDLKNSVPKLDFKIDVLQCESENADVYFANVAGTHPRHTEILLPCLSRGKQCSSKYIGKSCGFLSTCKMLDDFHSHGAVLCAVNGNEIIQPYFTSINGYSILTNESAFWNESNLIEIRKDHGKHSTFAIYNSVYSKSLFVDYILKAPITWSVGFSNGTEVVIREDDEKTLFVTDKFPSETDVRNQTNIKALRVKASYLKLTGAVGMVSVRCSAPFWNGSDFKASAMQPVRILNRSESSPPFFSTEKSTHVAKLGSALDLECTAEGAFPVPKYRWDYPPAIYNITPFEASLNWTTSANGRTSILRISSVGEIHAGEFVCTAKNLGGEARRRFEISIYSETSLNVYLGVAIALIAFLSGLLALLGRMYYLQRGRLTAIEIQRFENGDASALQSGESIQENAQYLPYNKEYEIKWKDFHISEEILGEGAYGIVYKGYLKKDPCTPVAIKTVKPGVEKEVIMALLSELKIMIYLGKHDNLVELKGACTEFLREGRVYIMVEYCPMGSLEAFLQDNKSLYNTEKVDEVETARNGTNCYVTVSKMLPNEQKELCFNSEDLVNWSTQILRGIRFLTMKKVIHGDLAARNILLVNKRRVKITDFGLSCQLVNYKTYVKNYEAKLPWRWLPPETLNTCTFTHKTDVWSFGILLWEIFSLGELPYSGLDWTSDFARYLESNLRLSKPLYATEAVYKIMSRCWATEPSMRPDFQEIEADFKTMCNGINTANLL